MDIIRIVQGVMILLLVINFPLMINIDGKVSENEPIFNIAYKEDNYEVNAFSHSEGHSIIEYQVKYQFQDCNYPSKYYFFYPEFECEKEILSYETFPVIPIRVDTNNETLQDMLIKISCPPGTLADPDVDFSIRLVWLDMNMTISGASEKFFGKLKITSYIEFNSSIETDIEDIGCKVGEWETVEINVENNGNSVAEFNCEISNDPLIESKIKTGPLRLNPNESGSIIISLKQKEGVGRNNRIDVVIIGEVDDINKTEELTFNFHTTSSQNSISKRDSIIILIITVLIVIIIAFLIIHFKRNR